MASSTSRRRARERRAEAGGACARPGGEHRHRQEDQREDAGAGCGEQLHAASPRIGPVSMAASSIGPHGTLEVALKFGYRRLLRSPRYEIETIGPAQCLDGRDNGHP
jgi:hypothetical protein